MSTKTLKLESLPNEESIVELINEEMDAQEIFPLLSEDPAVLAEFWEAVRARIARSVIANDPLEQILIREDCAEPFVEGLQSLTAPENNDDPMFAEKFEMIKTNTTVMPIPMTQVEENMKTHPMILCSIQMLSHHERVNMFLMSWKDGLKLDQLIQSTGCSMQPSYSELRLLFMLWAIEQSQQQQMQNQSRIITPQVTNMQPPVR